MAIPPALDSFCVTADKQGSEGSSLRESGCCLTAAQAKRLAVGDRDSRIMIIDDESTTVKVARAYLKAAGFQNFITVTDSTEALAVLRREMPDVALLDVMMPGIDGLDILAAVRGDDEISRLPVIILTAATDKFTKERALSLGATDFLAKPIDPIDLVLRVRNTLVVKQYQDRLESEIDRQIERLANEVRRTSMIINTANDAFVAMDDKGRITEWGYNALKLFGWSYEDMIGRPVDTILVPDEQGARGRVSDLAEAAETGIRLEMTARNSEGREFPVEISISKMELAGEVLFNAFVQDITERQHLQMQLANAQKLESIGLLAAGIAHEINTPIQFINDNLRFLKVAFGDTGQVLTCFENLLAAAKAGEIPEQLIAETEDAAGQADLEYLQHEIPGAITQSLEGVDRVGGIVRAMKEFSHPGHAGDKASVDINRAISSAIAVSTNEWTQVAEVVTDLDPDLPPVHCVKGEINQALLNLIVNAAHAIGDVLINESEDKGTITVSTRRADDGVEIRVQDTGTGIPEEYRPKIFDLFFTSKEVGKGTGQGLSVAFSTIVEGHGGAVTFDTEMGKGTTFVVRLPIEAK